MIVPRALLAGCLALGGAAAQAPHVALDPLAADGVAFGAPFVVTVERPAGAVPFDVRRLAPLAVELLDRSEALGRERLRYRARCFAVGAIALASEPPVTVTVRSLLPDPPGDLEWPADGYDLPRRGAPFALWAALAVLAALGVAGWARLVRRRPGPVDRGGGPAADAWSAAAALRGIALPAAGADSTAFYQELKAIVRRDVGGRFAVPAAVRTSEELRLVVPDPAGHLGRCLAACDAVLFARARPAAAAHAAALAAARAFAGEAGDGVGR